MYNVNELRRKMNAQAEHERQQLERGYVDWVLQEDVCIYGKDIPKGTLFIQMNADYYHPIINGARCPSYQVDFYIVKNNPNYFRENEHIIDWRSGGGFIAEPMWQGEGSVSGEPIQV